MKKELSFEQSLARLEEIVNALESGDTPLDTSMTLYEEGMKLVGRCTMLLENAEQKVKIIVTKENGEWDERDFKEND